MKYLKAIFSYREIHFYVQPVYTSNDFLPSKFHSYRNVGHLVYWKIIFYMRSKIVIDRVRTVRKFLKFIALRISNLAGYKYIYIYISSYGSVFLIHIWIRTSNVESIYPNNYTNNYKHLMFQKSFPLLSYHVSHGRYYNGFKFVRNIASNTDFYV